MTIIIGSTPPFSWVDGTNLEGELLKSQQICEAMQALTNRAWYADYPGHSASIPYWKAYRYNGDVLTATLSDVPDDGALVWYYDIATGNRFHSVSGLSGDPSVVDPINQTEYAARLSSEEVDDEGSRIDIWTDGIDGQTIFVDKDDSILIGAIAEFPNLFEATFYELQVILTTPGSVDAQVKFYYYNIFNVWVEFFPIDGTNGFRRNGVIKWSSNDDCPNWKSDHDPGGDDGSPGYYVKITRTQEDMETTPVPETIKLLLDPDRPVDKPGRHVNHIDDLRDALEIVLIYYSHPGGSAFTLASLMQLAVGRSNYNRTIGELKDLGYFDGEDLEEILKAIDLLTTLSEPIGESGSLVLGLLYDYTHEITTDSSPLNNYDTLEEAYEAKVVIGPIITDYEGVSWPLDYSNPLAFEVHSNARHSRGYEYDSRYSVKSGIRIQELKDDGVTPAFDATKTHRVRISYHTSGVADPPFEDTEVNTYFAPGVFPVVEGADAPLEYLLGYDTTELNVGQGTFFSIVQVTITEVTFIWT